MMSQNELSHTVFPLGKYTKAQVWELAADFANTEKKESQDICFVDNGDYAAFIEARRGKPSPEGDITDEYGRILGRHRGLIRYTLGQRRGLGISCNYPVYVAAKNTGSNTLVAGGETSLYSKTLTADRINIIACENLYSRPQRLGVKTRYLQKENYALVEQTGPDTIRVDFEKPQRAITPGQAAVFYDGDIVVGGGTIVSNE